MELNKVKECILQRMDCQDRFMSEEEGNILKAHMDYDDEAICIYAIGLLMNSSLRYKKLFFKGYDELQKEAFSLFDFVMKKDCPLAIYLMAQIKCGIFAKFPRYPKEGKQLFERYYQLTKDENTKKNILDCWDEYEKEMKEYFNDMLIYEVMNDLRNQGFSDFSSHDEAYYEEEK